MTINEIYMLAIIIVSLNNITQYIGFWMNVDFLTLFSFILINLIAWRMIQ